MSPTQPSNKATQRTPPSVRSHTVGYILPLGLVALAGLIRYALAEFFGLRLVYFTFFPAVTLAVLFGGLWPGLLATSLSAFVLVYWIWPPVGLSDLGSTADVVGLSMFAAMGCLISVVAGLYFRASANEAALERNQAVKESQGRFRALFEASKDSMFIVDQGTGRFVAANPAAHQLYGYSNEEFVRMRMTDITVVQRSDQYVPLRLHRTKDGTIFPVEMAVSHFTEGGRAFFTGCVRDITERKRAEDALTESEERFRRIFEEAPIGAGMVSLDYRFVRVNQALCEILGYTPDEFSSLTFRDITHPEDLEKSNIEVGRLVSGEADSFSLDKRYIRKDGTTVWVRISVRLMRDMHGEPSYFLPIVQDMTERNEAEEELRRSRIQLSEAMDLARIVYWEADPVSMEFIFNDPYYALLGTTAEQEGGYRMPLDEPAKRFWHPDDREAVFHTIEEAVANQDPIVTAQCEHRALRRDGELIHILNRTVLTRNASGNISRIYGVHQDITARKRAEEALRMSEEKHRNMYERAFEGIFQTSIEGEFMSINPALAHMHGYLSPEDMLAAINGPRIDRYLSPKNLAKLLKILKERGVVENKEIQMYRKDGNTIWTSLSVRGVKDPTGKIVCYEGMVEDITARKMAEQSLRKALIKISTQRKELETAWRELQESHQRIVHQEKMASIGHLAAGVAHEINNPTGFIISNLSSLQRYMDNIRDFTRIQSEAINALSAHSGDNGSKAAVLSHAAESRKSLKIDYLLEDLQNLINESLDGADRIKRTVLDLKNFARADETEFVLEDINAVLESTLNIVWNELKYKATIKKEYGTVPLTRCNPRQLGQVFMNILVNAAQAITDFGEIGIKSWAEDGHIRVAVSDTGRGIPENDLSQVFEPFFTTKDIGQGTGLGLSIAYDIVKKHRGEIEVMSEVGKGTTFTVEISVDGG
jgi:PAS domain S-box-containing protein